MQDFSSIHIGKKKKGKKTLQGGFVQYHHPLFALIIGKVLLDFEELQKRKEKRIMIKKVKDSVT